MASNSDIKILKETKLINGGFVYVKSKIPVNGKTYWEYNKVQSKMCKVRTITNISEKINTFRTGINPWRPSSCTKSKVVWTEIVQYNLKWKVV